MVYQLYTNPAPSDRMFIEAPGDTCNAVVTFAVAILAVVTLAVAIVAVVMFAVVMLAFQYQLARALEAKGKDRQRALQIQQKLVTLGYPAAFDNLGWIIISERKDYSEASNLFRKGTQLGDPDAMVSLAEMIDRGRTFPLNPSETKLALYARAARLGHLGAARALQLEQEKQTQLEQHSAIEAEQQRRTMEMFQLLLRNAGRR